jgi:hypothetical protein
LKRAVTELIHRQFAGCAAGGASDARGKTRGRGYHQRDAVMSAGLALAAREAGAALQYHPAQYTATGVVIAESADASQLVAFVVSQEPM